MSFWKSYLNNYHLYDDLSKKVNEIMNEYYNSMTNNPQKVRNYYDTNAYITFNKHNMTGFENLSNYLASKNIRCLEYKIQEPIFQQVSHNSVLINVMGEIKATMLNYSWFTQKFQDTFIIEYRNGVYLITNHVFLPIPPQT